MLTCGELTLTSRPVNLRAPLLLALGRAMVGAVCRVAEVQEYDLERCLVQKQSRDSGTWLLAGPEPQCGFLGDEGGLQRCLWQWVRS